MPLLLGSLICIGAANALPSRGGVPGPAAELQARHAAMAGQLEDSTFGRPIRIQSTERNDRLDGRIDAELAHPFGTVAEVLGSPRGWCDVLVLLPHIRDCRVAGDGLLMRVGRSFDEPIDDTRAIRFDLDIDRHGKQMLQAVISAERGPLGTHDYRIAASAVPIADGRTFLSLEYGHGYGFAARTAARLYLATSGADKVGFTEVGRSDGEPEYIGGLRGAVERNAMRLYLAIDARLQAQSLPALQRHERSLRLWLDAIADFPRQLREPDPAAYYAANIER